MHAYRDDPSSAVTRCDYITNSGLCSGLAQLARRVARNPLAVAIWAQRGAARKDSVTAMPYSVEQQPNEGDLGMQHKQSIVCPTCGLQVQHQITSPGRGQTAIDHVAYVRTCVVAPERDAFKYDCPDLQSAISDLASASH